MNRFLVFSLSLLPLLGCGDGRMSDQDRMKLLIPNASPTTPVRGKLLVDGKPCKDVFVYLLPKGSKMPTNEPPAHRAQVKADGSFAITTYLEGDGAPAGQYVICLEWLQHKQKGNSWVGPDKLGNRYNDPDTSAFVVTVDKQVEEFLEIEVSNVGAVPAQSANPKMVQRENKKD